MQTVLDSNLRALSIFVHFWKNVPVLANGQDIFCNKFHVVSGHYSHDAKEADILKRFGLPLNGD